LQSSFCGFYPLYAHCSSFSVLKIYKIKIWNIL
jgi:hypothetical protein